eukprot:TRINITY_DN43361_c0_g1_i1.p1 TRINITY_DN43361_c0_g1~~TRINITY_DN43361_c0_g1_i1.p1  ORF type:complete len:393 (+),score=74.61 TRINITY_DN43361_c0_g1_i1:124-1302(+)
MFAGRATFPHGRPGAPMNAAMPLGTTMAMSCSGGIAPVRVIPGPASPGAGGRYVSSASSSGSDGYGRGAVPHSMPGAPRIPSAVLLKAANQLGDTSATGLRGGGGGAGSSAAAAVPPSGMPMPLTGDLRSSTAMRACSSTAGAPRAAEAAGVAARPKASAMLFEDFMATPQVRHVQERFLRLLELLERRGLFSEAAAVLAAASIAGGRAGGAAAAGGVFRLAVPFCGSFVEAPTLAAFLSRLLQQGGLPGVSQVQVLCSDILPGRAAVALACVPRDQRIRFQYEHLDLSEQDHPAADLVLGMQPEVTRTEFRDMWQTIVCALQRAAPLVVFTTLQDCEAAVVREHLQGAGVSAPEKLEVLPGVPAGCVPPESGLSAGYDNLRYCHVVIARRN